MVSYTNIHFLEPIQSDSPSKGLRTWLSECCDSYISWGNRCWIWLERGQAWKAEHLYQSKLVLTAKVISAMILCLFLFPIVLEKFFYRRDLLGRTSTLQNSRSPSGPESQGGSPGVQRSLNNLLETQDNLEGLSNIDKGVFVGVQERLEKHPLKNQILKEFASILRIAKREFEAHPLQEQISDKFWRIFSKSSRKDSYHAFLDELDPKICFNFYSGGDPQIQREREIQEALRGFVDSRNISLSISLLRGCRDSPFVSPKLPDPVLYSQEELLAAAQEFFNENPLKDEIVDYLKQRLLQSNYSEKYESSRVVHNFLKTHNVLERLQLPVFGS